MIIWYPKNISKSCSPQFKPYFQMVSTAVHRSNPQSFRRQWAPPWRICAVPSRGDSKVPGLAISGHDGHGPKPRDVMGYVDGCRCLISSLEEVGQNMSQPKSSWEIEANQRYKILAESWEIQFLYVCVPYKGRTSHSPIHRLHGGPWCLHADIHIVCLAPNAGIHQDLAVPCCPHRIPRLDPDGSRGRHCVVLYLGDSRDILQISSDILDLLGTYWEILGIYSPTLWYRRLSQNSAHPPRPLRACRVLPRWWSHGHSLGSRNWGCLRCGISVESMVTG